MGSSSLKATLFEDLKGVGRLDFRYLGIGSGKYPDHESAMKQFLEDLGPQSIKAIGHRMTHGGSITDRARLLDGKELARLRSLVDLAPLHLPHNLRGVELCKQLNALQVGCYDTSFHADLPQTSRRLPLPASAGVYRCGFHGLNYAHIAGNLPALIGPAASKGRIAIAHLGNGSSLCLIKDQRSYHTSMGWTPLGGVPMGTRCGDLDPGVVLHLLKRKSVKEIEKLMWQKSGLLALSDGRSSQMQSLLNDASKSAQFAVDYYCRRIAQEIGGLAALANGLDALIFTGGIGENAPSVRQRICEMIKFLGFSLSQKRNRAALRDLHTARSRPIYLIKADEERYMQQLIAELLPK